MADLLEAVSSLSDRQGEEACLLSGVLSRTSSQELTRRLSGVESG